MLDLPFWVGSDADVGGEQVSSDRLPWRPRRSGRARAGPAGAPQAPPSRPVAGSRNSRDAVPRLRRRVRRVPRRPGSIDRRRRCADPTAPVRLPAADDRPGGCSAALACAGGTPAGWPRSPRGRPARDDQDEGWLTASAWSSNHRRRRRPREGGHRRGWSPRTDLEHRGRPGRSVIAPEPGRGRHVPAVGVGDVDDHQAGDDRRRSMEHDEEQRAPETGSASPCHVPVAIDPSRHAGGARLRRGSHRANRVGGSVSSTTHEAARLPPLRTLDRPT